MKKFKNSTALISSEDDGDFFWSRMGSFFASKKIRKEFGGYALDDSETHFWLVSLDKDKNVKAFLGMNFEKGNVAWITEIYTLPEFRQKGLSTNLIQTALEYIESCGATDIKVVIYPNAPFIGEIFKKHKFQLDFMKGKYSYLSKSF